MLHAFIWDLKDRFKGEVCLCKPKNLTETEKIAMDIEDGIRDSPFCVQHVQQFCDKQFPV